MAHRDLTFIYPFLWILGAGAFGYLIYIIWKYAKDLKQSPRELWFVSLSQVVEFVAYTLMNTTFTLFLTSDVGMNDIETSNYLGIWSVGITITVLGVGALTDAIGVKKVLMAGTVLAIFSRLFFAMTTNIYALTVLAFIPQAMSVALLGPVISVAIKRFTTKETSAMGFALFYTLMNIGYALGGWFFDFIRGSMGEYGHITIPLFGTMSTYRFIMLVSFIVALPTFFLVKFMREGIDLKDDGQIVTLASLTKIRTTSISAILQTISSAFKDSFSILKQVASQKQFWKFMILLAILLGVNYVFYHFHYTFPKYGIRVFGEGAKIGTIYGVLNPVIIVFIVPFIGWITRKASSYAMLTLGTFISAFSVFFVVIPSSYFAPLADTVFGRLIWDLWLGVSPNTSPEILGLYIAFAFFVGFFTLGEAIWSPRFMEYTARIAPKGQEGSYLSLTYLPKLFSQPLVAYMSGQLLATYVPMKEKLDSAGKVVKNSAGQIVQVTGDISNHQMVWFWVGIVAIISPIGMVVLRKFVAAKEE